MYLGVVDLDAKEAETRREHFPTLVMWQRPEVRRHA
jgi:hypothetical protein